MRRRLLLARRKSSGRRRQAYSLVEMIAATALVAGTLAPALAVMRDAMAASREASRRNLLTIYAVRELEYAAGITMQAWSAGTSTGNYASEGRPTVRYRRRHNRQFQLLSFPPPFPFFASAVKIEIVMEERGQSRPSRLSLYFLLFFISARVPA